MKSCDKLRIIENYRALFLQHGEGAAVGQWSEEGQRFRFARLAQIAPLAGKKVLEVGCGIGDLYPFLLQQCGELQYTGIDIVPELIDHARLKHPGATFHCLDLLEQEIPGAYDFVLISGVFNNEIDDATGFLCSMITRAFATCREGLAFNFTSTQVSRIDDGMAYHDASAVLDFCLKNLTPKVVLAHHYERCDVSVFLYR